MDRDLPESLSPALDAVMCVADSKWVLGHWYIKVMQNGRSLTDFNALAAMSQDQLGHTRAFFSLLEQSYGMRTNHLEFERPREQIRSMALLDQPPTNWADFIVSATLAELALQVQLEAIGSEDKALATLARQCRDECDFHVLYFDGSLQGLSRAEQDAAREALARRFPLALQWLEGQGEELRQRFMKICESVIAERLGEPLPRQPGRAEAAWDPVRRRPTGSSMPAQLWEFVLPTNEQAVMCRRPLMVSTEDGIRFSSGA